MFALNTTGCATSAVVVRNRKKNETVSGCTIDLLLEKYKYFFSFQQSFIDRQGNLGNQ